ncbi:MAG TPA: type ISP restriction/modification enzyme [Candidatus Kapabacteria bacterium]|nr:type ISP restriction/modification enzyme [Candidatus Kapabacteria bacterium]
MPNTHIQKYLAEVQSQLSTGIAKEHAYRPALKNLLTALFPKIKAVNDAKKIDVGAPDFHLLQGETPVGYIEAKDIGLDLDDKSTQAQTKRYIDGLANVVLTDYLEFRWYLTDTKNPRRIVILAEKKGSKIIPIDGSDEALLNLLTLFVTNEDARTVKSAKELAKRMANLAKIIRDIISAALKISDESTQLHETMKSFKDVLLHDLDDEKFADMYAQTICYGMFAARVNHNIGKSKFERKTAGYDLPKTNPFLRQLFNTIAGPELDERVIWAVDDLANLLHHADMEGILKDFGKRTRQEDPVVHFYETFLAAYDPKLRESRGVYYTPEPVVSYIVRSVDHILKTDFGLEKGLADSTKIKPPSTGTPGEGRGEGERGNSDLHKVLILDPACGTGTFLHGVIDQIHENFKGNEGAWSSYVSEHLLPRIFGFELLMAPYAVAHLKLGLQLKEFGYDFKSEERLRVYLTNTLEEAFHADEKLPLTNWLAKEANAANEVKRDLPIMVVLGNPPYEGTSANVSWSIVNDPVSGKKKNKKTWIGKLLMGEDIKKHTEYYEVDGHGLGEKNPKWLQNDYVKFIRFAEWRIQQTGFGVLAFITANSYLDNPTFKGMRQHLINTFDNIYLLDLHGSSTKGEKNTDGGKDENVFDITQGVSIALFIKKEFNKEKNAIVKHANIFGSRESKYSYLFSNDVSKTKWKKLSPQSPNYYFFIQENKEDVSDLWHLKKIFNFDSMGITTGDDGHYVSFTYEEALKKEQGSKKSLIKYSYRPFDDQWLIYNVKKLARARSELNVNLIDQENMSLVVLRRPRNQKVENFFVTHLPTDKCIISTLDNANVFPLYLYPDTNKKDLFSEEVAGSNPATRAPNLSAEFIKAMEERLRMKFVTDGKGNLKKTFGPEDVFHYMYAIFHSPTYRTRYAEFLKIDFPRLPLTSDLTLFAKLCKLGEKLVKLHLMEKFGKEMVKFPVKGSDEVEYVEFESDSGHKDRVVINDKQYFESVPKEVWEFHIGGYQVAHKWLKDRKGRKLNYDDIEHYKHIISALSETMRLMKEIDVVISAAGGFPLK